LPSDGAAALDLDTQIEEVGLVSRLAYSLPPGESSEHTLTRWALIADPHVAGGEVEPSNGHLPAENLKQAVEQIQMSAFEGVIVAGDLALWEGLPDDYAHFHEIIRPLESSYPTALTTGNHDERKNMAAAFCGGDVVSAAPRKLIVVIERPPIRWIILDSLYRTDVVSGLVGKAQRNWLKKFLSEADATPTFILVHHPPDDGDNGLLDGDRLLRMLAPRRQVKALVYAHAHHYRFEKIGDLHLMGLPATGFPFVPANPVGWVEAEIGRYRGKFTLRTVASNNCGDGRMTTLHWRYD
jgi:hypothetical protein